jgi:hypothetical protein
MKFFEIILVSYLYDVSIDVTRLFFEVLILDFPLAHV